MYPYQEEFSKASFPVQVADKTPRSYIIMVLFPYQKENGLNSNGCHANIIARWSHPCL